MKRSTTLFLLIAIIALSTFVSPALAGTVNLQWTQSTNATGYYVYKNDVKDTTATVTGTAGKVTVTPGKYKFNVTAYNASGESAMSNSVYTPDLCTVPQGFAVAIAGSTATFSWTGLTQADGYKLYVNGAQSQMIPAGTLTATLPLPATGSVSVYLTAYNGWGESAQSTVLTIVPVPNVPASVVLFSYAP